VSEQRQIKQVMFTTWDKQLTVDVTGDIKRVFLQWDEVKSHFGDARIIGEVRKFREESVEFMERLKKEVQSLKSDK